MQPSGELYDVMAAFCNAPAECSIHRLGNGNINDTYLVEGGGRPLVLQKINKAVFPQPERVIQNFQIITDHLSSKNLGNKGLRVSKPVFTLRNTLNYMSKCGNVWRGQTYVKHFSYRQLQSTNQAYDIGSVLSIFHNQLQELEPGKLSEPLPGFHDLRSYLSDYDCFLGPARRLTGSEQVQYCHRIIKNYRDQALSLHGAMDQRLLQRQIVHGDPKLENFMFDSQGRCLGLLDLDTVGLGLIYHDLGDSLRSCCNVPGEKGIQPLIFDLEVCTQFLKGYLSVSGDSFTHEIDFFIYHGIVHICFELGLRFFIDYLRGNVYFKVENERDNLYKAVSQFQLLEDIVKKKHEIRAIVRSIV